MSRNGIVHRTAKVSLAGGVSTVVTTALQLILVPVCINFWGQESYGRWLSLFSALMLLRSLEVGYVVYVGNKLNYLYHKDSNALREHLSSAVAGIALLGSLQLLLAAGTLASDPLATILGMPAGTASGLQEKLGLVVLTASWVMSGSYIGIVHRLQIPAGMMYQAAWWYLLIQVSQYVTVMAAALLRLDILQSSILFALSQFVIYVASAIYVRQTLPAYYPWWRGGRISIGFKDLSQSMMLTVSNLIQQGSTNGIVLIVSALAGPAAVPVFTTVRTIANLWTNVTNILINPLLPDVVRFHAKGEAHKLMAMNEAYWVLLGSVVNWGVLLSYPLLEPLYGFWTGHVVALDKTLLCLLLGSVVVTNTGALMNMHLGGINSLWIVLKTSIVRGVVGLGGGALGYGVLGLTGFGLGIFTGELVILLMMGRFFIKHELVEKGVKIPVIAYAPTTLGTGSVLFFLTSDGFSWLPALLAWPMALAGVAIATVWGWQRLEHDIRVKIEGLVVQRFK